MLYHDVTDPYLDEATSNKIEDVTMQQARYINIRGIPWSPKTEISGGPIKPKPAQDVAAKHQKDVAQEVLEGGEVPENEDANGTVWKKRHGLSGDETCWNFF